MHRFTISTYKTVHQSNDKLRAQISKRYKGIKTVKISEFENTRSNVKNVAIAEKKVKQYITQIIYTNPEAFTYKS